MDAEGVPRREEEPEGWGEGTDGAGGRKRRPDSVQHTPAHGFFQRKKVGYMYTEVLLCAFSALCAAVDGGM